MTSKLTPNKTIRIVATGDSMTDTAGPDMTALDDELKRLAPQRQFELINQGVGGTRVGYGLWRLTHQYEFQDKIHPPLISLQPDIVLIESFAYNNGSDGTKGEGLKHFLDMHHQITQLIQQKTNAEIVYVATVAPNPKRFLETVPSFVHTPVSIRKWMAEDRVTYLEAFEKFAIESGRPLANVYRASLAAQKNGTPLDTFINPKDSIHPGTQGHQLIAKTIAQTLLENNLI